MKIADLKKEMDARFGQVDARFAQVDARFEAVEARLERVEVRLDHVDKRIETEHETTRRHMDVIAEQFRDYVKVLAEGIGLNTERLNRHEKCITALERGR